MKKFIILTLLMAVAFVNNAHADTNEIEVDAVTQIVSSLAPNSFNLDDANKKLARIGDVLKSGQVTSDDMSGYVKELAGLQTELHDYRKIVDNNLSYAQKKVDALGEAPKEGETEPEAIQTRREQFNAEYQALKTKLADVDVAIAKIDELESMILNIRNQELFNNLLTKHEPLINPSVLLNATALSVDFMVDIVKSPYLWYMDLSPEQKHNVLTNMLPVLLTVLITILVAIYLRAMIMRKLGYRELDENEYPRYATKVIAALFVAFARGIIPGGIIVAFLFWIYKGQVLSVGFFGLVLTSVLTSMLWIIVFCTIARVTFAPHYDKWRIIQVDSFKAKKLTKAFYFAIIASGIVGLFLGVAIRANYAHEMIYLFKTISAGIKAFSIVWIVKVAYMSKDEEAEAKGLAVSIEDSPNHEFDVDMEDTPLQAKIEFVSTLAASVVFLFSVFGYPNLSLFILNRFIGSVILIGVFMIIRKSIKEISHRLLLTQLFAKTFKFRRKLVEKVDFWTGLISDPILFILAGFSILTIWGVSTDLMLQSTKKFFMGFQVGGVTISLLSILIGIGAFVVCLLIIKFMQSKLRRNVWAHMDIDDGIKHSLDSGFGFIGIIFSILIGIVVMGGNLSSLAIIAGALSVGIGFGLQSIVNNLVSGFILLFERPVKIGDWVIIDGNEGLIKQINIRATIIETWDKANVIIPNATLLSSNLINMTWHDKLGRADIKVGVAYGTDLDKVRQILLEIANAHPKVTSRPAPYVVVNDFGDSSIDVELRAYINDVMSRLSISSALREAIKIRFEEERIEIPFPQQVVHDASQNVEFLRRMAGKSNAPKAELSKAVKLKMGKK